MNHPIIFYDGECGLCQRSVQWILKNDQKRVFRYASLQGETARGTLPADIHLSNYDTVILLDSGNTWQKSTAALGIIKKLPIPWKLLQIFFILPTGFNNQIYDFIASRRRKWFPYDSKCKLASLEEQKLFLP